MGLLNKMLLKPLRTAAHNVGEFKNILFNNAGERAAKNTLARMKINNVRTESIVANFKTAERQAAHGAAEAAEAGAVYKTKGRYNNSTKKVDYRQVRDPKQYRKMPNRGNAGDAAWGRHMESEQIGANGAIGRNSGPHSGALGAAQHGAPTAGGAHAPTPPTSAGAAGAGSGTTKAMDAVHGAREMIGMPAVGPSVPGTVGSWAERGIHHGRQGVNWARENPWKAAGIYAGAAVGMRLANGGTLTRDGDGSPDIVGVPLL